MLKIVGTPACYLELPHIFKIYPIFYISFLFLTPADPIPRQSNAHPSLVINQDADEKFQVEEILNSKLATS